MSATPSTQTSSAPPAAGATTSLPPLSARPPKANSSASASSGLSRVLDTVATAWDRTSIYLPIVLMGFLALVSYWVVSLTPIADLPPPERAASQAPDSIMRNFAIQQFSPDGTLKSELFGDEMRRYPYNDTTVIDRSRGFQISPTGRRTTFSAQRLSTNADQSIYWLEGSVLIIREALSSPSGDEPQIQYQGESLTFYVAQDRLESNKPVLIIRGNDRISANNLRYDDNTSVVNMQGRVRALLAPRKSP